MTSFARLLGALMGLAVAACAWLPWALDQNAWHVHIRSLVSPGQNDGVSVATSVGLAVTIAGVVAVLGALLNSRAMLIIGGLLSVGLPATWILSNAISTSGAGLPMSRIQVGAYGAAALGILILILAALARDTRVPTAR